MATKEELLKRKTELEDLIKPIQSELSSINKSLDKIKEQEWQDTLSGLWLKYEIELKAGMDFVVSQEIQDYCEGRGFCNGYYRSWIKGQTATIKSFQELKSEWQVRAECFTGHTYRQGIGLNDEQRNKQIKLMSPETPLPIELVVRAINGN